MPRLKRQTPYADIARNIAMLRARQGVSMDDISKRWRVSLSTAYERLREGNLRSLRLMDLMALADILKCSPHEILGGQND